MKKTFALLFIFLVAAVNGNAQRDSSGAFHPSGQVLPDPELVVILGDNIIYDTVLSYPLLKKYAPIIKKRKYYSSIDGYKKFNIHSKEGILVCTLKKGEYISIEGAQKMKKE